MQILHFHGVLCDTVGSVVESCVRDLVREVVRWDTFSKLFVPARLTCGVDAVKQLIGDDRLTANLSRNFVDAMSPLVSDHY